VCLGADTRATGGTEVADKNCEKIHYLADNIYCCGAGTAADTEKTTEMIASQLELHRLNTGTQPRVVTAVTLLKRMLFRYQGHVSAALVLGGCDLNGPHLYHIYPHGSTGKLPYVTMGSGSLAAMSVFEAGWKEGMTEAEAIDIVKDAIHAGIFNDLGSGSNVDITVIPLKGQGPTKVLRGFDTPNEQSDLRGNYERPKAIQVKSGATAVLEKTFAPLSSFVTIEDAPEPMAP
jgi:20S proteasome subunit beta 2